MRLHIISESTVRYWKWIHSNKPSIHGVPGFVFVSATDAKKYTKDFDDWSTGPHPKQLYTFTGVEPTTFPILFGSALAYNPGRVMPPTLDVAGVQSALNYFSKLPDDFFINRKIRPDEIEMFMALARTVGCLKPELKKKYGYVYDVEAYYALPATMTISPQP